MKILVFGTWHSETANKFKKQANELGKIVAERGHILIASPSKGIQGLVAKSYKDNGGTKFIGYYPKLKFMKKIGEEILIEPDRKVMTHKDYPIRNLIQIKKSDAIIVLTGGTGTLSEVIATIKDYKMPIGYYKGSSILLDKYFKIDPETNKEVFQSKNMNKIIDYLEENFKRV